MLNYNLLLIFLHYVLISLCQLIHVRYVHRDVVRYDPTRHDHSTYERKSNDKPKER